MIHFLKSIYLYFRYRESSYHESMSQCTYMVFVSIPGHLAMTNRYRAVTPALAFLCWLRRGLVTEVRRVMVETKPE